MHTRPSDFVECTSSRVAQDVAQHIKINFSDKNTACFLSPSLSLQNFNLYFLFEVFELVEWYHNNSLVLKSKQKCSFQSSQNKTWQHHNEYKEIRFCQLFKRGLRNVYLLKEIVFWMGTFANLWSLLDEPCSDGLNGDGWRVVDEESYEGWVSVGHSVPWLN